MGELSHGPKLRYAPTQNHDNIVGVADTDMSVDPVNLETSDLSQWLYETYYDDDKKPYFTKTDLRSISKVLLRLLRFRPSERPSASDIILEPLVS